MSAGSILKREARVAFSRRAQPTWFRALKWIVILVAAAFLWRRAHFWWWVVGAFVASLMLHLVWRWKTKGWTQPWGGWNDVATASRDDGPESNAGL
jgi:hypothetical protein